ncbi:sensor histidine kinase [Planctomicrobium sp. SH664]|uniref:sensor histidine kinase n=1 Tax=Planctomicrobium sp. SH664 TaxID=3448125 RepID=UPI003F5B9D6B
MALDPQRMLTQVLHRKWQVQQGLPKPSVVAIRQTRDGRLWLGTQSGVYQFDGVRFSPPPFATGAPLDTLWVEQFCEDQAGRLWIATLGQGLIQLHHGLATAFTEAEGLPSLNVQALAADPRGVLWIGTDQGLVCWTDGEIQSVPDPDQLVPENITSLCSAPDGVVWIGGENGSLTVWNGKKFLRKSIAEIPSWSTIHSLLSHPDGHMWIGTNAGLYRSGPQGVRRLTRRDGLADGAVESLALARTGQVWVGTRDGVSRVSADEVESFRTRDGLTQSTVYAVYEDHEGSLWVGTKNGLNQFVDRRTIPLTTSEGLPSDETGPVLQDSTGTIWIGTLDQGLARFDGRRCQTVATRESGLPSNQIRTLAAGEGETLWVGTDRGLCLLRSGQVEKTFTQNEGLPDLRLQVLLRDPRGTLWAGTRRGLARLQGNQFEREPADSPLAEASVLALLPLADGTMLIAVEGEGIYQLSADETERRWPDQPGLRNVTAWLAGPEGSIWLATRDNGLFLIEGEQLTHFTIRQGLYDDEIFGLTTDDQGRLWMACSRGIFYVAQSALKEVAAGRQQQVSSTPFSPLESLRTIECQRGVQPSVWRMQDGRLWFATIYGILILDPPHLQRNLPLPRVEIERVLVNGRPADPRGPLILPAGSSNLAIGYAAMSFASPSRIQFRYRLEGFDEKWIEAGSRRDAFYTNLPAGEYAFHISAANPEADWSSLEVPLKITIRPYFYQTFWFISLCCAALALLVWVILRLRVLQLQSRMNGILTERARIARDLHDTLIQGFSGVTMQMQALATQLRDPEEQQTLHDVISDASHCLREARRTVAGLRQEQGSPTGLVNALAHSARHLTETRAMELELDLPSALPPLPGTVEYQLLRIAQEAITNAVKHSQARRLRLALQQSHDHLQLSIEDDGCGFDGDDELFRLAGHYGLIGMRERAHQIGATIQIQGRRGTGTLIHIDWPLGATLPHVAPQLTSGGLNPVAGGNS